jgi:hydrogenase maturation protein HypF
MREPWRNTLAHLLAEMGWSRFEMNYGELELTQFLRQKPITALQSMMSRSPLATSCGRLFDAVAGAVGLCREQVHFEGQAAMRLEAIADESDPLTYPFNLPRLADSKLPYLEPLVMWEALLGDLVTGTPASVISARFHRGLADAITRMVVRLCRPEAEEVPVADTVVLTGGVFQNTLLTRWVRERLEMMDFRVLTPTRIPANDGGVSLGQALIAAAHRLHSQPLAVPGQFRKVRTCV